MIGLSYKVNFLGRALKPAYFWTVDRTEDWITNPWTGPLLQKPDHPFKAVWYASLAKTQLLTHLFFTRNFQLKTYICTPMAQESNSSVRLTPRCHRLWRKLLEILLGTGWGLLLPARLGRSDCKCIFGLKFMKKKIMKKKYLIWQSWPHYIISWMYISNNYAIFFLFTTLQPVTAQCSWGFLYFSGTFVSKIVILQK